MRISGQALLPLAAAACLSAGPALAGDGEIRLFNNSDNAVLQIYVVDIIEELPALEMLGGEVIPPGGDIFVDMEITQEYCFSDLLVVYDSGELLWIYPDDICSLGKVGIEGADYWLYYF